MKNIMTCLMLALGILAGTSFPAAGGEKDTGIGFMVGEPTGLSAKKWLGEDTAIDAGLAWAFSDEPDLHIHADMLWHNWQVLDDSFEVDDSGRFPLYYGVGARFKAGDDVRLGARFVLGASYIFTYAPFDIFGEIAPILDLAPGTEVRINVAVGCRFRFSGMRSVAKK